jgi:epoxyqueuosine reductase QueG
MNSSEIKQQAQKLGAQLCGIAPVSRFSQAPEGFSPLDLFPETLSVISFAKQISKSLLSLSTFIPYTVSDSVVLFETHRIAFELSLFLESKGFQAVLVPSEPYEYWDAETKTGKGLVSLKHLAHQCGLGVFGRNQLLYNSNIGNLMKIGAVLTNAVLEPDEIIEQEICKSSCQLCIKSCPSGALSEMGVNQFLCRNYSETKNKKGIDLYTCVTCRKVCPNISGFVSEKISTVYLGS